MEKKIPPMKSLHVQVVGNHKEARHYFNELREKIKARGYDFHENTDQYILAEEEDEYRFLTPDRPEKLIGLQVADYQVIGTGYDHPHIIAFINELGRRIY